MTGEISTRITGSGSYAYDGGIGNGVGNPTSFKGTTNTFNSNNQNTANTYDGNGSPTTYRTKTLTFDPENRMSGYNGSTQTNVYSGDGLRATKAGSRAGKYLYDDNVPVIEFTASNEVSNTFGPDGLVSRHVLGGVTTFYTFDERGNVSQRLTNTGSISSTDAYDVYGTRSSTVSAQPDPWGYEAEAGYYTDTETGLILCTHRFYDPATGRWLTRDPIGYDGGTNLYGYVGNDPGNENDPEGYGAPIIRPPVQIPRPVGMPSSWPDVPAGAPGGPYNQWEVYPPGSKRGPGYLEGEPQRTGGRWRFQYVPKNAGKLGNPDPYWKYLKPGCKWQRIDMDGNPKSAQELHPGNPKNGGNDEGGDELFGGGEGGEGEEIPPDIFFELP